MLLIKGSPLLSSSPQTKAQQTMSAESDFLKPNYKKVGIYK